MSHTDQDFEADDYELGEDVTHLFEINPAGVGAVISVDFDHDSARRLFAAARDADMTVIEFVRRCVEERIARASGDRAKGATRPRASA